MKILFADQERTFCLHIPLMLLCNRAGAALLAGGIRRAQMLPDGSKETAETGMITADQAYAMLKVLRQSKKTLRQAGLPLLDIEQSDGGRFAITL